MQSNITRKKKNKKKTRTKSGTSRQEKKKIGVKEKKTGGKAGRDEKVAEVFVMQTEH